MTRPPTTSSMMTNSDVHGNGNQPPSPKSAAATMPTKAPANGAARRPSSGNPATAATSRRAPASGLAQPVATASGSAHQPWRSFTAASAPIPKARPSAKGSRPTIRSTTHTTANQSTAKSSPVRDRPRSKRANAAVAAMQANVPTSRAPNNAASGGNSNE